MPDIHGAAVSARPTIANAIARASQRTGTSFDFLMAEARIESALNPGAKAPTSSAAGLFQFTSSTWLDTLDKHGADHGLGWASAAIERRHGKAFVADPAMRQQLLALRHDPETSAVMAGALTQSNSSALAGVLGRAPDQTEMYLAHFLGASGAIRFLSAMREDANQSAAALFPEAAGANRSIFLDGARSRSLSEVHALMASKLESAGAGNNQPVLEDVAAGWGGGFGSGSRAEPTSSPKLHPMSDILRSTFGGGNALPDRAGRHIAAAYAKLSGFGL